MGYNIDLTRISVLRYRDILKNQNLLPGRRMLLENIDENFHKIENSGVHDLAELKAKLSSVPRLSAFALETGVPGNYLLTLKREMGSLEQKPVPISDFPGISADTAAALQAKGVKTSKDVYDLKIDPNDASAVSREMGLAAGELQELNSLCDLVRINGVGPIAARTLYESGHTSAPEIARAKAGPLLEGMNAVNADKRYYMVKLGEKDMQFIIDAANILLEA